MEQTSKQVLEQAIAAHQSGELEKAECKYRLILQNQLTHPDANHNLGVLISSYNRVEESLKYFKTALDHSPNIEQFWYSYIDTLIKAKKINLAKQTIDEGKKKGLSEGKADAFKKRLYHNHKKQIVHNIPSKKELNILLDYFQDRKFNEAENQALLIIKRFPKHQFSWKVLGILYEQTNRLVDSLTASKKAVELNALDSQAHYNLGNIYSKLGKLENAIESYNQAIKLNAKYFLAYFNLGNTLIKQGKLDDAKLAYQKVIALNPNYAEAHNNLGTIDQQLGNLKKAEESYRNAIYFKDDFIDAQFNLSNVLKEYGKFEQAEAGYKKVIKLNPNHAEAHNNLGVILQLLSKFDEAKVFLKKAVLIKSNYSEAYYNLGNILQQTGKLEEAEINLRKSISLKNDFPEVHNNLGGLLQEIGKLKESLSYYKQAIKLKPDYAEAHRNITLLKKFNKRDNQFLQMKSLLKYKNLSIEQRCNFNFALAKALEDLGEFKKAFKYYCEGNALRKNLLKYDISQDISLFKDIKNNYIHIAKYSIEVSCKSNNVTPIFIIGMPRSGTTLVEQIISSHSKITGAGELPYVEQFGNPIARGALKIDKKSLTDLRQKYLHKLNELSNGKLIVTDKMPQNFKYIGLLSIAFPEAKFVHVKRNSHAVCWANFKQYFTSQHIGYCYDLDDIVSYYRLYQDLIEFWHLSVENRIYDFDYENLTENQEDETKKLIHYLDLDWEQGCLSPENNKRSVATASNLQVRKKVYKGSSEQWKKYEPFINGTFKNLNVQSRDKLN